MIHLDLSLHVGLLVSVSHKWQLQPAKFKNWQDFMKIFKAH